MSKIDISKDVRFLQTALAVARIWSKDPSSQVAAIAVGDTPNQVAWGYNGDGECDVPEELEDVEAIAAGSQFSMALRSDGTVEGRTEFDPGSGRTRAAFLIQASRTNSGIDWCLHHEIHLSEWRTGE